MELYYINLNNILLIFTTSLNYKLHWQKIPSDHKQKKKKKTKHQKPNLHCLKFSPKKKYFQVINDQIFNTMSNGLGELRPSN